MNLDRKGSELRWPSLRTKRQRAPGPSIMVPSCKRARDEGRGQPPRLPRSKLPTRPRWRRVGGPARRSGRGCARSWARRHRLHVRCARSHAPYDRPRRGLEEFRSELAPGVRRGRRGRGARHREPIAPGGLRDLGAHVVRAGERGDEDAPLDALHAPPCVSSSSSLAWASASVHCFRASFRRST